MPVASAEEKDSAGRERPLSISSIAGRESLQSKENARYRFMTKNIQLPHLLGAAAVFL